MQRVIAASIASVFLALILWIFLLYGGSPAPAVAPARQAIATAFYQCDEGKTINATYYEGETKPPAGQGEPPKPGGSVDIQLSDGRSLRLQQTISADGVRYSNGDPAKQGSETQVFWSKGHGAFVLENEQTKTFDNCIELAQDPGGLPGSFASSTLGLSIRYPRDYRVDTQYLYKGLGPGDDIAGIKFTVGSSTTSGTNLAPDTYLAVEEIPLGNPASSTCSALLFLPKHRIVATTTTDHGSVYSYATSTGAGAGNRYEETVYALPGSNPCVAIRYFVHYGALSNYPPGAVEPYDDQSLKAQFDAVRQSLILEQRY